MRPRATLVVAGVPAGKARRWAPCNLRDTDRPRKVGEEVGQPHQGKMMHLESPQTCCYAARVSAAAVPVAVEVNAVSGPGAVHRGAGQ